MKDVVDRRTIGGSKVAMILDLIPAWGNPYDVYLQIVEGVEKPQSEYMYWGIANEPAIRQKYIEVTGHRVEHNLPQAIHPDFPFLTGHYDAKDHDANDSRGAVVECKQAWSDRGWGPEGSDQVPPYYLTQGVHYMGLEDVESTEFAILFTGNTFRRYRVERDKELEGDVREECIRFWKNHVLPKKPPPQGNSKLRADWIKKRWPTDTDPVREATPYEVKLLSALQYFRTVGNVSELIIEQITQEIKTRIGNAAGLMWGKDGRVTWKQSRGRAVTSWKDLALAQSPSADLIQKHTVGKPGARPFLVPRGWKKDAVAYVNSGGESHPVEHFEGLLETAYPGDRSEVLETLKEEGEEHGTENHANNNRELQTD